MQDLTRHTMKNWKQILAILYITVLLVGIYCAVAARLLYMPITTTAYDQLDVDYGIRRDAVETTPNGISYIWVGNEYGVRIPQPYDTGIVMVTAWLHPSVVRADVQYGSRQLPIYTPQTHSPRRLFLLVDNTTFDGIWQFTIKSSKDTPALKDGNLPIVWAFSSLQWIPADDMVNWGWLVAIWAVALLGLGCIATTQDWWQIGRWITWCVCVCGMAVFMPFHFYYWWIALVLAIGLVIIQRREPLMRPVIWAIVIGFICVFWSDVLHDKPVWQMGVTICCIAMWLLFQTTITRQMSAIYVASLRAKYVKYAQATTFDDTYFRYINIATCAVALVTCMITMLRPDKTETWDQLTIVGAAGTAFMVFLVLSIKTWRKSSQQLDKHTHSAWLSSWIIVGIVVVFWWFTFQEEELRIRVAYLGFPPYVFMLSLIGMWFVNALLLNRMSRILQIGISIGGAVILVGGVYTAFVPVNLIHNMYVINEILVPISDLIMFNTFIPQYATLYSLMIDLLKYVNGVSNPDATIDTIYLSLQMLSLVTVSLAVRMNYINMVVPRWSTAIIFSVPPILFATSPWWEVLTAQQYFSINMFSYSLIANRALMVFLVGTTSIWVLSRIQLKQTLKSQMWAMYGLSLLAMLGLYNNSDFGTFAAIGVGAVIVCYPFLSMKLRVILTSVYAIGVVVNYMMLLQFFVWCGMAVNTDYLYWFQRQFATGFGAIPLTFPGNGLFLICTAVVIAVAGVWMGVLLRNKATTHMHDIKLTHMYTSVVYFGVTTMLGVSYYVNRSYMSVQGSSVYITLFMAVFALYNMILYLQSDYERRAGVNAYNFVMRFLVAVPLSIALTHTYIPRELPRYEYGSALTKAAYEPVMSTIKEYRDELEAAGFTVAYGGDFGHVVELYVGIPAVSLFNSVQDTKMSPTAKDAYCSKLLSYRKYDVIMVLGMWRSFILPNDMCDGMVVLNSEHTQINLFVRREFITEYPDRWNQLQIIMLH